MHNNSMSRTKSPTGYAAPALSKGLRLLETLAASPLPLGLAELGRAIGKSSAEIFRMLAVLEQEGYVRRDPQGAYLATLKLFTLGRSVDPLRALLSAAAGPMRDFARLTGQECHLSVLEEGQLVVIAQESGTAAVTIRVREGSRHNPLATASGRLLLALLPPVEAGRQVMLARALFKGPTVTDIELRRAWKQIARARCSTARNESLAGLADTAVPVRGTGAWTHAALASSHFLAAKDSSRLAHALNELRAAATAIAKNTAG